MTKKNFLYFENINFHKKNLKEIKKTFNAFPVKSLSGVKKLNEKIKKNIDIIYCDPLYFYSSNFLKQFKNLKFLASSTTSTDFIDLDYCNNKKIKLISLEKEQKFLSSISSTAEHTFGLILLITRKYLSSIYSLDKFKFNRRPYGGYKMLSNMCIGIVGYGRLGKLVKKIASGFSMKIITCDIKNKNYKKVLEKLLPYVIAHKDHKLVLKISEAAYRLNETSLGHEYKGDYLKMLGSLNGAMKFYNLALRYNMKGRMIDERIKTKIKTIDSIKNSKEIL